MFFNLLIPAGKLVENICLVTATTYFVFTTSVGKSLCTFLFYVSKVKHDFSKNVERFQEKQDYDPNVTFLQVGNSSIMRTCKLISSNVTFKPKLKLTFEELFAARD